MIAHFRKTFLRTAAEYRTSLPGTMTKTHNEKAYRVCTK
ncbi:hypothetical protein DM40_5661 [Burkholderia cenocepacia]|nr:hypothetical protein DM40_5661 [Burkholderia cenocepacia]